MRSTAAGRNSASIAEWQGCEVSPAHEPASEAGNVAVDRDGLQQLQRQIDELHALLTSAEPAPAAPAPARVAPVSAPSEPVADDYVTLRMLRNQIEGLFALCLRHAERPHDEMRRD